MGEQIRLVSAGYGACIWPRVALVCVLCIASEHRLFGARWLLTTGNPLQYSSSMLVHTAARVTWIREVSSSNLGRQFYYLK
jgi:hypothetical protein